MTTNTQSVPQVETIHHVAAHKNCQAETEGLHVRSPALPGFALALALLHALDPLLGALLALLPYPPPYHVRAETGHQDYVTATVVVFCDNK